MDEAMRRAMDSVSKRARRTPFADKLPEDRRPHSILTIAFGEEPPSEEPEMDEEEEEEDDEDMMG